MAAHASSRDSNSSLRRFHSLHPSSESSIHSPRLWGSSFASTAALRTLSEEDLDGKVEWIAAESQANRNRVKRLRKKFREEVKLAKKGTIQAKERRKVQKALFHRLNRSLDRLVEDTANTANLVQMTAEQREMERKGGAVQTLSREETRMGSCITKPPRMHDRVQIRRSNVALVPFSTSSSSQVASVSVPLVPIGAAGDSQEIMLEVSEEGEIGPFRVSIPGGEMEYSDSDMDGNSDDSEVVYSMGSALRDSMELLREGKRHKEPANPSLEEMELEITQLKQDIAAVKKVPTRSLICLFCHTGRPKVLFRPCRHLVCCSNCAPKAFFCPVCEEGITTREEVFL